MLPCTMQPRRIGFSPALRGIHHETGLARENPCTGGRGMSLPWVLWTARTEELICHHYRVKDLKPDR